MTVSYPLQAFEKSRVLHAERESQPERTGWSASPSPSPSMC